MTLKDLIKKPYFQAKHNHLLWYLIFNRNARNLFEQHSLSLTPLAQTIVTKLTASGIAFTTLDDLFPGKGLLNELLQYAENLKTKSNLEPQSKKSFLRYLWDAKGPLDLENPFAQLAMDTHILDIANSYLKMYSRLNHITLNITLPVPKGQNAQFSQRWHRDPQEQKQLKMFIYLSDVTSDRGPFSYVAGSNYGNKYGTLFPQRPPEGSYPPEGAVEKAVDTKDVVVATGKPGTVIFCDTSGLHRGGYATGGERLMFTSWYTAPSYVEKHWYSKRSNLAEKIRHFNDAQRFALYEK